jgi:hypothetical protein
MDEMFGARMGDRMAHRAEIVDQRDGIDIQPLTQLARIDDPGVVGELDRIAPMGPAMARAAARGRVPPFSSAKWAHADSKLAWSLVCSVATSPSETVPSSARVAMVKRAWCRRCQPIRYP